MVCYFKRICGINQAEDRVTWPDLLPRHTIALASFREWSVVSARLRIRAQPRNPCRARNSASAWRFFVCENVKSAENWREIVICDICREREILHFRAWICENAIFYPGFSIVKSWFLHYIFRDLFFAVSA